jgi:hypothetical protein
MGPFGASTLSTGHKLAKVAKPNFHLLTTVRTLCDAELQAGGAPLIPS